MQSLASRQCAHARPLSRGAWPAQHGRVRRVRCRAELEEIDPITGQPISKLAPTSSVAGNTAKAGGLNWAYREAQPDPSKASADKPDVLLLHGLGSSSYCYRNTMGLIGGEGYRCIAPDWPGHGDTDKPGSFGYSEEAYISGLGQFVDAVGIKKPFALVVHGFVLSQYAMLYAQENPNQIARLLILNSPLALNAKLRPELAAYKAPLPFMRPGNKPFDFMVYNMTGSPYAMKEKDAMVYARPTSDPAATSAIAKTMDQVDFPKLLRKVDDGFRSWRKPTVCLFGSSDPFVDAASVFEFLESKRTNMKALTVAAKLGHMPQEDFPESMHESVMKWLSGETDADGPIKQKALKMTKYGVVESKD
ncbi:hypothetical protein CHLRE_03g195200v5 [Chlamydomonas reinhardtii]|uniref:Uncharacterized protein n=1 Tax=Chlamydomonas reinhardtii TaxID=3055 RepID=A8IWN6_CHLRE|nr:uncharacterized protein CHLRE_03g195200v5 [Chlamydomonas reinhardtii]PNW85621.1 hypothetical protein CHLRE_03g195200v5 [Chlamydomonas reinhardtii]|eukprot:XP_001693277.1 predicted protein [Chlamydomonas reinhardtii]